MALRLDLVPEVKTIDGVYQGQQAPIEIGTEAVQVLTHDQPLGPTRPGPHFVGTFTGEDSLTLNAFFDPSLSNRGQAGAWDKLTYLQAGMFSINGVAVPLDLYNPHAPMPVVPQDTSWMDICPQDSRGQQLTNPYYPLWARWNDATIRESAFYKYPQPFGGFAKYQRGAPRRGDNLCPYMTSTVALNFGALPIVQNNDAYFSNLDLDDLNFISVYTWPDPEFFKWLLLQNNKLPGAPLGLTTREITHDEVQTVGGQVYLLLTYETQFPLRAYIAVAVNAGKLLTMELQPPLPPTADFFRTANLAGLREAVDLNTADMVGQRLQYKKLLPPNINPRRIRSVTGELYDLYQYASLMTRGEGRSFETKYLALRNAQNQFYYAELDEEALEEFTVAQAAQSRPNALQVDVENLRGRIQARTGMFIFGLNADKPLTVSYEFAAYAANVQENLGARQVLITPFEGFAWKAKRVYDPANGWGPSIEKMVTDINDHLFLELVFKREINEFYGRLGTTVNWQ